MKKKQSIEFNTAERKSDRKAAIILLRDGINSKFWKFLCEVIDQNVEITKEEILTGEFSNIEQINQFKIKLEMLRMLKSLPESMIDSYSEEATVVKEEDDEVYD
jgi:hypothetical protein